MRHAKSSSDHPGVDDFDRPLNERGRQAAKCVARELERRGLRFDNILASTAARVRETIDCVQKKYDFAAPIHFDARLYLADDDALLSLVRSLPNSANQALLVGHNPGLHQLLLGLTCADDDGLRGRVAHELPTGAFVVVEFPIEQWDEAQPGSGRMVELILPNELD